MSAFVGKGKADVILGKADIKKCPLMTQSGHPALETQPRQGVASAPDEGG